MPRIQAPNPFHTRFGLGRQRGAYRVDTKPSRLSKEIGRAQAAAYGGDNNQSDVISVVINPNARDERRMHLCADRDGGGCLTRLIIPRSLSRNARTRRGPLSHPGFWETRIRLKCWAWVEGTEPSAWPMGRRAGAWCGRGGCRLRPP